MNQVQTLPTPVLEFDINPQGMDDTPCKRFSPDETEACNFALLQVEEGWERRGRLALSISISST